MVLITCQECGNKISELAESCPHCGYPINKLNKTEIETFLLNNNSSRGKISFESSGDGNYKAYSKVKMIGMSVGLLCVMAILCLILSLLIENKNEANVHDKKLNKYLKETKDGPQKIINEIANENYNNNNTNREYKKEIIIMKKQKQLIAIVDESVRDYRKESNELRKSNCRLKRKNRFDELFGKDLGIRMWVGVIKDLGTLSNGKAMLRISLYGAENVTFQSDAWKEETLIEPKSVLYESLMKMEEGELVEFGGILFKDDLDYIEEDSVTESGSMENPEFVCWFKNVSNYYKADDKTWALREMMKDIN